MMLLYTAVIPYDGWFERVAVQLVCGRWWSAGCCKSHGRSLHASLSLSRAVELYACAVLLEGTKFKFAAVFAFVTTEMCRGCLLLCCLYSDATGRL